MLIDFHTHVFPDKIAERAIESLENNIVRIQGRSYPARTRGRLAELEATMKEDGVDYSVVLPIATTVKQSGTINRFAAEINGRDGIFSFGSLHPMQSDWENVLCGIAEAGLKGIKLHPEYQGVFADSPEVIRVVKKAEELGLYTVFHAGRDIGMPEPVHCSPQSLLRLLEHVHGDRIIAAHLGGWRMWDEVSELLCGTPIIFDTSYLKGFMEPESFRDIVRAHGSGRIVFGTDHPWQRAKEAVEFIEGSGLSRAELDDIYFRNAVRILGI